MIETLQIIFLANIITVQDLIDMDIAEHCNMPLKDYMELANVITRRVKEGRAFT